MICKHAPSGCNYPEGECVGLCMPHTARVILPILADTRPTFQAIGEAKEN